MEVSIKYVLSGHTEPIYCLSTLGDSGQLLSGSGDGFVGLWDLSTGIFEKPLAQNGNSVYSLSHLTSQNLLAIGLQNGVLNLIDLESQALVKSIQLFANGIFAMEAVDDMLYLCSGDGNLAIVDVASKQLLETIHLSKKSLRSISIAPCKKFAIIGASDYNIYFLDLKTKKILQTIATAHKSSVFSAIYSESYTLISGGRDAMLRQWTWQEETKEWLLKQAVAAHNYTVNKVALSPNKQLIATGSRDKTIKIWDAISLQLLKVINAEKYPGAHSNSVNTLVWQDDNTIISSGDDKRIIVWEVKTI